MLPEETQTPKKPCSKVSIAHPVVVAGRARHQVPLVGDVVADVELRNVAAGGAVALAGQLAERPHVPRDVGRDGARPQTVLEADGPLALALLADLSLVVARLLVRLPQAMLVAGVGASCLIETRQHAWWELTWSNCDNFTWMGKGALNDTRWRVA